MASSDEEDQPQLISMPGIPPGPKRVISEKAYNDCIKHIIRRDFFIENPDDPSQSSIKDSLPDRSDLPGLEEFLGTYINEDDAYFHTLDLKDLAKYRAKHPWMFEDSKTQNEKTKEQLKVPSMEEQAKVGADGKVKEPVTWAHNPQSHIFFPPEVPIPKKSSTFINRYSSRLANHDPMLDLVSTPNATFRLYVKPNKIGIDGKAESESSRTFEESEGNKSSHSTEQTDPAASTSASIATNKNRYIQKPRISAAKTGQDRYYLPSASPRDDLAHRLYEEKVAEAIKTPRSKGTPKAGSMSSVRSSSINSDTIDSIRVDISSRLEKGRKK